MKLIASAGKHAAAREGVKKCHRCKGHENMSLVESAGKHVTDLIGGGKTRIIVIYMVVFSDYVCPLYFHLQYFD